SDGRVREFLRKQQGRPQRWGRPCCALSPALAERWDDLNRLQAPGEGNNSLVGAMDLAAAVLAELVQEDSHVVVIDAAHGRGAVPEVEVQGVLWLVHASCLR